MNFIPETAAIVSACLDGSVSRHQVGALNIANVNTTDFRQKQMDFESYVKAVEREPHSAEATSPERFITVVAENAGMEKTITEMAENVLYYETVLTGWEKYVGTLRLAITDGKG